MQNPEEVADKTTLALTLFFRNLQALVSSHWTGNWPITACLSRIEDGTRQNTSHFTVKLFLNGDGAHHHESRHVIFLEE